MKFWIILWNLDPLKWRGTPLLPIPFSPMEAHRMSISWEMCGGAAMPWGAQLPVQRARKFSAVLGTRSA